MRDRSRRTTPQRLSCRLAILAGRLLHVRTHLLGFSSPRLVSHTLILNIFLSVYCVGLTFLTPIAQAQTSTIAPDATLPTASRVTSLEGTHTISKGTPVGPNLFHSFSDFQLGTGDTAHFLNPSRIENILSRVTGSNSSNLFGELRSDSSANLFFLNPNGVVFGPDATLNINGSFHVSTADSIQLGTGEGSGLFSATSPQSDILVSAPPAAFGFLSETPASIQGNNAKLQISEGKVLSVVGGDITITDGSLTAPNGQIVLVSVAGPDSVSLSQPLESTKIGQTGGVISLSEGAEITAAGDGGGTVMIRGGRLIIDRSNISAGVTGPTGESFTEITGSGVDIMVDEDIVLDHGSTITTNVFTDVVGLGSGGIRIQAEDVKILDKSYIQSNVLSGSRGGSSGDIEVDAESVFLQTEFFDVGALETGTSSSQDSGNIHVRATKRLNVLDGSFIWTFATGAGQAGNIEIDAGDVTITSSQAALPNFTAISSQTFVSDSTRPATGDAGNIRVTANSLEVSNAEISTPTFAEGDAGDIDIATTGDVSISGDPSLFAGFFTNTVGSGEGGNLSISANNLSLTNLASLQAATFDSGNAGDTAITLRGDLVVENGAFIQSRSTQNATGSAGNLEITARDISIMGISDAVNFEVSPEFTGISASTFNGPGGNIHIMANSLSITDKAFVNTATFGPQASGDIAIDLEGKLVIENGGQIFANTRSSGDGGHISIETSELVLSGVNPIPSITLDNRTVTARSAITSRSQEGSGKGGDILVSAQKFQVLDGAAITTESTTTGTGGNIDLIGGDSILLDQASITTQSANAEGGNINLNAKELIQISNSEVTSRVEEGSGRAGRINIDPDFVIIQNSNILSTAVSGDGGPITIIANSAVLVDPFSTLDASSQFGGNGTIDIQAPIQQLSEAIAPLPEDIVKAAALYAEACASQKSGQFSSMVKSADPIPSPAPAGGFLVSPLTLSVPNTPLPTTQANATHYSDTPHPPHMQTQLEQMTWSIHDYTLPPIPFQTCSTLKG